MTSGAVSAPSAEARTTRVRLEHLWAALPLVFVFYYACSLPIVHSDFFYNLTNGRLIVEGGKLLDWDVLTYAPHTSAFYNQPWLTQVLYFFEMSVGGYPLVIFVHALVVGIAFGLVWLQARGLTGSIRWASSATLLAIVICATNLSIRPQAYSFLPFALTLLLLERYADDGWPLYLVPLVVAVWANLHGAFLVGVGIAGIYCVGALLEVSLPWRGRSYLLGPRRLRRLTLVFALALIAMLANPYGYRIVDYWLSATGNSIARSLNVEWRPTAFEGLIGPIFFLSWLPLAAVLAAGKACWRWTHALLVVAFAVFALVAVRNVVWWGLLMPPLLAALAARSWTSRSAVAARREIPALNAALLVAMLVITVMGLPWLRASNPLLAPDLRGYLDAKHPVGAVEYLKSTQATGRLFSRMEWGGYLEWELWPRLTPFLDARIEIHPSQVWLEYFGVLGASSGWSATLDKYQVDYVVLERQAFPDLIREIGSHPGWKRAYQDDFAVIFVRQPIAHAPV